MDETLSVRPGEPSAMVGLAMSLEAALARRGVPERPVVFACIGTDRSTGDALGPLVGQKLRRLGCGPQEVVGTLEHPLHALNLAERITPLLQDPRRPLLVAVDAALGASANVGSVHLRPGGLRPGQGVGKDLPEVGELSVTATVNIAAGGMDAQVLQSTRLFMVQNLAETIGTACWWAMRSLRRRAEAEDAPLLSVAV
ncbi:MAG TPA: spore protease YyaC [Miltoncostaeaceae bacterium]|nr:spore protease YyaC [Miltoncostaeaceae bacterium]